MNEVKKVHVSRYLGLDIGTNSIGWALYDEDAKDYSDSGVVVFEEAIQPDNDIQTPAALRTQKRMARRLIFRRRLRKVALLKILIREKMCPLNIDELNLWYQNGEFPLKNKAFLEWQKSDNTSNPYADRAEAVRGKIDLYRIGRAFYHIAQRRGFKSSRKDATATEGKDKGAKDLGVIKKSIAELSQKLEEKKCTLGEYFYEEIKAGNRVRASYTGRKEHYIPEVRKICEVQQLPAELSKEIEHVLFFQRPLRSQAYLAGKCPISGQRRAQISHPDFERYRMWSFINNIRIFEDNNAESRALNAEELDKIAQVFDVKTHFKFEKIIKTLYSSKGKNKGKVHPPKFNYSDNTSVKSCPVTHQLNEILGINYNQWQCEGVSKSGQKITYNYQVILDALNSYDDDEMLRKFLISKLRLTEEQAEKLIQMRLPEGYAQYSLCVIRKILRFLEKGIELSTARFLANIPSVIGDAKFNANCEKITGDILNITQEYRKSKEKNTKIRLIPLSRRLENYMKDAWNLHNGAWEKLYKNSSNQVYKACLGDSVLPKVQLGMLRNPVVQRTLSTLRKLINYLNKVGKINSETQIHIELARSVNNRNMRKAYEKWQEKQEKLRNDARAIIEENNQNPNDESLILRVRLALEQDWTCMYTGEVICISNLLSPTSNFDIEHTIPRALGGNNSMANKTLCVAYYNRQTKKTFLPSQCPDYDKIQVHLEPWQKKLDELEKKYNNERESAKKIPPDSKDRKSNAQQKALVTKFELMYWREKVGAFFKKAEDLDDNFINRQLTDTGIITRHALEFLRTVYPRTYAVNGQIVAHARKVWGLQEMFAEKDRSDHTHHAVDAMVIALLSLERFKAISTKLRSDDKSDAFDCKIWAEFSPIPQLYQRVLHQKEKILVKHITRHNELKPTRKMIHLKQKVTLHDGTRTERVISKGKSVRNQLHKESFYGCIQLPNSNEKKFVIRKPLNTLDEKTIRNIPNKKRNSNIANEKPIRNIVDEKLQQTIVEQLNDYQKQGIEFSEAIKKEFWMKKPCQSCPKGVPIKTVRLITRIQSPQKIKDHLFQSKHEYKIPYYAETAEGCNFKIALFSEINKGKECVRIEIINLLDFVQGKTTLDEIRSQKGFKFFISNRDCVLIFENDKNEIKNMSPEERAKRLYKNVKYSKQVTFKFHREARSSQQLKKYLEGIKKSPDGASKLNFITPEELLRISPSQTFSHLLFEHHDFEITLDGQIDWLF